MTEGEIDLPGANSERNKLGLRTDATSELAALLRSKRRSLQQVQSGLSKVLTLDPPHFRQGPGDRRRGSGG
jgi:hypothetical protein